MFIIFVRAIVSCYWAYKYLRSDDQLKKIEYLLLFGLTVHR